MSEYSIEKNRYAQALFKPLHTGLFYGSYLTVLSVYTASVTCTARGAAAPAGAFSLLFAADHTVNQHPRDQRKDDNQNDIDQIG